LSIEASWAANVQEKEWMETRLFGTEGGLVQHNVEQTYKFEAEMFLEQNGAHFDLKLHSTTKKAFPSMYHFVDAIVTDTPHPATGYEGLLVMQILDAIYRSAETGEPVHIA
jgi:predicted dehydrogenase